MRSKKVSRVNRLKKKVIHVNRHNIAKNKKQGDESLPVFTVKTYNSNDYGHEVILRDETGEIAGRFVYSPKKPLSCGAVVWFESNTLEAEVIVRGTSKQPETATVTCK